MKVASDRRGPEIPSNIDKDQRLNILGTSIFGQQSLEQAESIA